MGQLSAYVPVRDDGTYHDERRTAIDARGRVRPTVDSDGHLAALTTRSVAIAEEMVHDAFEQLHKNWATIEQPAAWLRAAVVNRYRPQPDSSSHRGTVRDCQEFCAWRGLSVRGWKGRDGKDHIHDYE